MNLEIKLTKGEWNYKLSGVYKITFESGGFYIGSSNHLRSRASAWTSIIKRQSCVEKIGSNILAKIIQGDNAVFEVIEFCSPDNIRDREAFYIMQHEGDTNMLCWLDGVWKPVLQHAKNGHFIKRHLSIRSAARYNSCRASAIERVLDGHRLTYKGMIFSYESDYNKRSDGRFVGKKKQKKNGRLIAQIDDDGNIIETFQYIAQASRKVGCNVSSVNRVLGGIQKTAGGYFFKFTE